MAVEILGAIKLFVSPLTKGSAWVYRKGRLLSFRFRNRKPPFDESAAKNIAFGILGGTIERGISYKNIDSKHCFISAIRRSSDQDLDDKVYVLEQTGDIYRRAWCSGDLHGLDYASFEVVDIDADGSRETVFAETSFGTGAGQKVLTVYSPSRKKAFEVIEIYNWQDATGPVSPEVEIRGLDDGGFLESVISHAKQRGFLQDIGPIDLENPEFAIQRWHKENGAKENGRVSAHIYHGLPQCDATVVVELDTGDIRWTAYFKGPLYAYIKSKDQHFIAYSPAWVYNWVTCMVFDGRRLWFEVHVGEGLFSFEYESMTLALYVSFEGRGLPEVREIELADETLVLNGDIRIAFEDLRELSRGGMKSPEEIRRTGRIS